MFRYKVIHSTDVYRMSTMSLALYKALPYPCLISCACFSILGSSSFPQVPIKVVSYLGDFVHKIMLFDSRVDIRMSATFPNLLRQE